MKQLAPSFAFALLMGLACSGADAQPAPPQLDDVRAVGAFRGIDLAGTMVVEARIGGTTRVAVEGDADLVKLVTTTVRHGVLVIDTPKDFPKGVTRKHTNLKVVVSAPELASLTISGTGTIAVTGLAARSLAASIPGTGSMKLAGTTQALQVSVPGTGQLEAQRLVAGTAQLDVPGTAEVKLHATKAFEANVLGTAVVHVHGKPASVKKHVRGTALIDVK